MGIGKWELGIRNWDERVERDKKVKKVERVERGKRVERDERDEKDEREGREGRERRGGLWITYFVKLYNKIMNRPSLHWPSVIVGLALAIAAFIFAVGLTQIAVVFGWTNPSANPPSGSGQLTASGGNLGVGTSTPRVKLGVQGAAIIDGFLQADYINATSTSATSTFNYMATDRIDARTYSQGPLPVLGLGLNPETTVVIGDAQSRVATAQRYKLETLGGVFIRSWDGTGGSVLFEGVSTPTSGFAPFADNGMIFFNKDSDRFAYVDIQSGTATKYLTPRFDCKSRGISWGSFCNQTNDCTNVFGSEYILVGSDTVDNQPTKYCFCCRLW